MGAEDLHFLTLEEALHSSVDDEQSSDFSYSSSETASELSEEYQNTAGDSLPTVSRDNTNSYSTSRGNASENISFERNEVSRRTGYDKTSALRTDHISNDTRTQGEEQVNRMVEDYIDFNYDPDESSRLIRKASDEARVYLSPGPDREPVEVSYDDDFNGIYVLGGLTAFFILGVFGLIAACFMPSKRKWSFFNGIMCGSLTVLIYLFALEVYMDSQYGYRYRKGSKLSLFPEYLFPKLFSE